MNFIKRILISEERQRLVSNIGNLFIFQGINYVLPLVTIPYIVRVIGPANFGILSFAQVINNYFVIISDYGFNISATQLIAKNQSDSEKRNEAFSAVLSIKLLLMIACLLILVLATFFFAELGRHRFIYLAYFLMVPGNIFFSNWLFLGMEEMKYLTYPNLVSKLVYTITIFIFLHRPEQFEVVAWLFGASWILGGLVGLGIAIHRYKLRWKWVPLRLVKKYLADGWHLFISTFSVSLYRQSNIFILGLVGSDVVVGYYSAAEKIIKVIQSVFNPVIQAFYPFVSRKTKNPEKGLAVIKKLITWLALFAILVITVIIITAPPFTSLFLGEKFHPTIRVLQIGSISILFSLLNYAIGIIFMTNYGMKELFTRAVILTGIFNLLSCYLLSLFLQHTGAAIAFSLSETVLFGLLIWFSWRNKEKWSTTVG